MNRDELLQEYLARVDRINRQLQPVTVCTPFEPIVKPVEKTFDIPPSVWDNPQYGRIDDLIDYVRTVNQVPRNVAVEVAFEEISRVFRIKFQWWEITVLTERGTTLH